MGKIYYLLFSFLLLIPAKDINAQDTSAVYLIFDETCIEPLPLNYRKMNEPLQRLSDSMPDLYGLSSLNASGSSQFCTQNLPAIINNIKFNKITIVDLRQESHGFVNGSSLSWFGRYNHENIALNRDQIEDNEEHRLDSLKKAGKISVTRVLRSDSLTNNIIEFQEVPVEIKDIDNEEEITERFKLDYFRIPVTDHRMPEIQEVDRFIKFVRNLKDMWLHFHCGGGYGRTTTFLAMYDMIRNAKEVSLRDILQRQYLIGGINLAVAKDVPEWDKQYAVGKTMFLKDFYDYCKTNQDNFNTLYSEWLKK